MRTKEKYHQEDFSEFYALAMKHTLRCVVVEKVAHVAKVLAKLVPALHARF
jgi:hypothetical protein